MQRFLQGRSVGIRRARMGWCATVCRGPIGILVQSLTELRDDGVHTLQGDLVLKGGGDAELGLPQLWALLVELQQQLPKRKPNSTWF